MCETCTKREGCDKRQIRICYLGSSPPILFPSLFPSTELQPFLARDVVYTTPMRACHLFTILSTHLPIGPFFFLLLPFSFFLKANNGLLCTTDYSIRVELRLESRPLWAGSHGTHTLETWMNPKPMPPRAHVCMCVHVFDQAGGREWVVRWSA